MTAMTLRPGEILRQPLGLVGLVRPLVTPNLPDIVLGLAPYTKELLAVLDRHFLEVESQQVNIWCIH